MSSSNEVDGGGDVEVDGGADVDLAIIGAGIVGASVACFASPTMRVAILEAESAPGYHTTGRSAALYAPAYGPPAIRALTRASGEFLRSPPAGFAGVPLVRPRGALFVGPASQRSEVEALEALLRAEGSPCRRLDGEAACARVPALRAEAAAVAVLDEAALDLDVDAILQGFLRTARANGARVVTGFRLAGMRRVRAAMEGAALTAPSGGAGRSGGDGWRLRAASGAEIVARRVVNAAGAWVDEVARLAGARPIGIEPRRRTAFTFEAPAGMDIHAWPAVIAADETWYLKPDAGLLLGSPANADLVPPHDVLPEELDVAIGIDRIEAATTLAIRRPRATWAGLRCFVADGEPVLGPDPQVPGFFWAAALGGYGIQSSVATGRLVAAWAGGGEVPPDLRAQGFDEGLVRPGRAGIG